MEVTEPDAIPALAELLTLNGETGCRSAQRSGSRG